jgi:xanthine dehydrogenase YagS FAD-binding subunit
MRPLTYERATDPAAAVALVAGNPRAAYLAGGTNVVDHLKLGVAAPDVLVDVSRLPLDDIEALEDGGLRVGAAVRNSDLAAHPVVRRSYPVLAQALLAGASGQIRNAATTAGNLLQRTRCVYFQDVTTPCNKRDPGSGCSALEGFSRSHAVLGASDRCVATHPSDLAVALAALDATVVVLGPAGERRVPMADFHRLPGDEPERDTTLRHGDVRLALGGVAHKPWRASVAEERLRGGPATEEAFRAAATAELEAARPLPGNGFKVPLARSTITATLRDLAGGAR